ncbi:hypothetical protein [Fusobacterium nucleatum]|uniref:hypothetical protein n=1 Tax=Fusobacterium nucleatum TaxID=851 RepID=UPI000428DC64|nr:hypothetical protein [Fusobacterium nucleatum]ALF23953.1 hypothetical protein RO05_06080 [Fusobacterium nucleatum subsp. nucleatum ChDC F316]
MEEFQTEQKSNFFMGVICLLAGALVTCVLYFGVSRLGIFSFWVSAIGITISLMGYNHFVKGSGNFGFILGSILNTIGIIYGEFLDTCAIVAKSYDMSMSDLMFNTDLLREVLITGSFWIYPAIGIAVMLVVGFQNRKSDFSDKDNE